MARSQRNVGEGVVVQGLKEMQRALKTVDDRFGPEMQKRLKAAGEKHVAPAARKNAPRRTGKLAGSIKVSATQSRGATVYSGVVYGGVQNYGGRVGRNRATILRRDNVSQYMTRAVQGTRDPVAREVESVLDWLERELN